LDCVAPVSSCSIILSSGDWVQVASLPPFIGPSPPRRKERFQRVLRPLTK
jgi:hypothetical protein